MAQIQDPMEYIWDRVPKTKSGLIQYLAGDIPYLYENGFVDTLRFTYSEWEAAFEDCKQSDGSYLLSKEKFMSLREFRHERPISEPFNPQLIREGEWTKEDLAKLYQRSILPSSTIPENVFWNSIEALKKEGLEANGNLIVNEAVKKQLSYLVERFPSPTHKLEIEVSRLRKEREGTLAQVQKQRDKSVFMVGKTEKEEKEKKFKSLETSKKSASPSSGSKKPSNEIDIKKLRKPPKKLNV